MATNPNITASVRLDDLIEAIKKATTSPSNSSRTR
jgi:hypothetical protein